MISFVKKRLKRHRRDSFIKKKINKKIRQRPRSDVFFRFSRKVKKKIVFISSISIGIATVVVWGVAWQTFFYGADTNIQTVSFSSWSTARYSNQLIIQTIQEDLKGSSYRANTWFGISDLTTKRKEEFSIIQWVELQSYMSWNATVEILRNTPALLFRLPWNRWYGSYNEDIFEIQPQDWITSSTRIVDLPRYTEAFDSIDWIFWWIWETQLVEILDTIDIQLWAENISEYIYLPWWKKLFIWFDSKRRYLHLNKDIPTQINKINDVRTFFQDYQNISIIDLWSTDNVIVK